MNSKYNLILGNKNISIGVGLKNHHNHRDNVSLYINHDSTFGRVRFLFKISETKLSNTAA